MWLSFLLLLAFTVLGCSVNMAGAGKADKGSTAADKTNTDNMLRFSISYPTTIASGYPSRVDLQNEKWIKKQEELFNVYMDTRVVEDVKMGHMFAGGSLPDVVGAIGTPSNPSMSGSVEAGLFQPLTQLLKEHVPDLYHYVPEAAWDAVTLNGEIYGLPGFLSNPSRRATFIRMDLLKKTGKEVPRTIEEFVDVLRAFKTIGVQHPYAMRENFKYADIVLGAFDVLPYRDQFTVIDGEVVPKFFQTDKMMQALQTLKDMYDEGLIAKDFATLTASDFFNNIESGNAAIWSQNAVALTGFSNNIRQVEPAAEVRIIPSPIGPDGEGGYFYYSPVVTSFYINKNVEEERVIAILKFFEWQALSEEAQLFYTFGVEGETYAVNDDGSIDYYGAPKTRSGWQEESWRSGVLWAVRDMTMNRLLYETTEDGRQIMQAFDSILQHEGRGGIGFYPELETITAYPELAFPQQDVGPSFIIDNMVQMVYGARPIADWPKVLEEYRARGGDEIIQEATTRYFNEEGTIHLQEQRLRP
ncbi:extracellular solute-binding protein [Paenibacillus sp. J5C_2022]|uniref:extracellular solute-binding protein n=1 Tax=Paenibacillus sp. J5C2022 TaxID=2977129 RepID=UPI0021D22E6D|nr:extracellular solute-binding protein [Paenibacillus sp. J5C2022]MCU6707525.1 extracellular solute-binding protein [Paenibacillus sp. J5C2022]